MDVDFEIVNLHQQLHENSCIPSAVEMVLKLVGNVEQNYYDLQNAWNDRNGMRARGVFEDCAFSE